MNSIFAKRDSGRKSIKTDNVPITPSVTQESKQSTAPHSVKTQNTKGDIKQKRQNLVEDISDVSDVDDGDNAHKDNSVERSEYADMMVLSLEDIKRSVPPNASKVPLPEMQKTHTEWRWRFYNIEGRKMVEISKRDPNKNRVFIDNTGRWINFSLDASWDKYVVDTRHCYVKI
ncbi:hypothetical protein YASMINEVIRUS_997 [Yasminevirus sp. GU-2018]|uniref:Uncharacterized protein n=1 Tax=Yasminevirus sp. GU-2018 TaxID=2420051 RepID=A0A5K0UAN5_9VIRU|nr:hypothetical protein YASMINEVIRUS_997 [Yasminevirus sp. GU-2018]